MLLIILPQVPQILLTRLLQLSINTTSVIHLPAKLVSKDKIPKVRGEIVKATGEKKVAAVQARSPTTYRVAFTSSSYRHEKDVNGITFRGVTLTLHLAYEEVKSVFVDRAPLQMPDAYLYEILAPYSRVISIGHLKIKGFQNIKSGTCRVITKSIPATIKISNIQLSFRYRGQPPFCFVSQVGHTGKDCPKSQKVPKNTRNADLDPEDLRHKLNHVKEGDLQLKLNQSMKVSQAAPAGAAATSPSNSNLRADQPHTCSKSSNSNKTHASKPNNLNNTPNSNTINALNINATDMPNSNDQPYKYKSSILFFAFFIAHFERYYP